MREIKFRAWDKENNKMVYNVHLNDGKPVKPGYQWFNPQNTVHDSEPLQYTGLKDKNGVEIYEGDVLLNDEGNKYVTGFNGGMFTIVGGVSVYGHEIQPARMPFHSGWSVVIGNIYEHPHVLEGGSDVAKTI